jgi:hypothetical protein
MVVEIAKVYTSKAVQDSVSKYLDGLTWEQTATWMDDVRGDHSYDYMKTWHYINIEKDKTYVAEPNAENVIVSIQKAAAELGNRTGMSHVQVNTDLKLLFHLVGDEHMPLHVGYGEDKGGNDVEVDYLGKYVNLHHLWDIDMIEANLKVIQSQLTEFCKKATKKEINQLQSADTVEWMSEGRAYLPDVYAYKKGGLITKEYTDKAVKIITKQIFDAGVRLAGILNSAFNAGN